MKNNSEKNVILARTDGIVLARHPNNHWYLTSCPGAAYRMRESSAMNVLNHLIPESERDLWAPLYLGDGKEDLAEEEIVPVDELVDVMKQLARQLLQWQQKSCVAVRFADRVEQELSQALDMEESAEDRDRLVIRPAAQQQSAVLSGRQRGGGHRRTAKTDGLSLPGLLEGAAQSERRPEKMFRHIGEIVMTLARFLRRETGRDPRFAVRR